MAQSDDALGHFRPYLLWLARDPSVVPAHQDPSDLVQQTLLEAHRERGQFRGTTDGERAAWLRQILARNLADAVRAERREKRDVARERSLEALLEQSSARLGGGLAVDQSSPSVRAARHEEAVRLAAALEQLPMSQRDALVRQHWHGQTLAEIGAELGCTPAAVAGLLKRGLKRLRKILDGAPNPSADDA